MMGGMEATGSAGRSANYQDMGDSLAGSSRRPASAGGPSEFASSFPRHPWTGPDGEPLPQRVTKLLEQWDAIQLSHDDFDTWSPEAAFAGLACLEQLKRRMASVQAALICRAGLNRDSAPALVRCTGMSDRAARELVSVAQTTSDIPEAEALLAGGSVSAAQVHAVRGLSAEDALGLLDCAPGLNDDEFSAAVRRFKVDKQGPRRRARQRAMRSLTFFPAEEGCVGFRGTLPALEGSELQGRIKALSDAKWRAENPSRAKHARQACGDTQSQRMVDALVLMARGATFGGFPVAGVGDLHVFRPDRSGEPDTSNTSNTSNPTDMSGAFGPRSNRDSRDFSQTGQPSEPGSTHDIGPPGLYDPDAYYPELRLGDVEVLRSGFGRPVMIVTIDAATLRAKVLPDTPIGFEEAAGLIGRAQLFAAIIEGTELTQLTFGRNRRIATPLQRLAKMVTQPTCVTSGCRVPATDCELHHIIPVELGGKTDLSNLEFRCTKCHRHLHLAPDPPSQPAIPTAFGT